MGGCAQTSKPNPGSPLPLMAREEEPGWAGGAEAWCTLPSRLKEDIYKGYFCFTENQCCPGGQWLTPASCGYRGEHVAVTPGLECHPPDFFFFRIFPGWGVLHTLLARRKVSRVSWEHLVRKAEEKRKEVHWRGGAWTPPSAAQRQRLSPAVLPAHLRTRAGALLLQASRGPS